jgi:hypothetical protein
MVRASSSIFELAKVCTKAIECGGSILDDVVAIEARRPRTPQAALEESTVLTFKEWAVTGVASL